MDTIFSATSVSSSVVAANVIPFFTASDTALLIVSSAWPKIIRSQTTR